jgi:NAD(P)-dependent dehydrogenase (short-subunit alcohol dehydrogenase family)
MELELQNQVAVVLGAASGIGLAIAKAFAQEGAATVLVDRDERVRDMSATFPTGRSQAYVADVTDYQRMNVHNIVNKIDNFADNFYSAALMWLLRTRDPPSSSSRSRRSWPMRSLPLGKR